MPQSQSDRFILCRPRGGLNDTLCQIANAVRYCQKHRRTLVIDTMRSGLRDDIFRYFDLIGPKGLTVLHWTDPKVRDHLNSLETRPASVRGALDSYKITFPVQIRPVEPISREPLYIDFKTHYDAPVLVHEAYGGGISSFRILPFLRPTAFLQAELDRRLARLPAAYVGLHFRNTDLRTSHVPILKALQARIAGRDVLITTDDGALQEKFRKSQLFGARLHFVTDLTGRGSDPRHDHDGTTIADNLDMLCDLYALALAKEYHFGMAENARISGYSTLVCGMRANVQRQRVKWPPRGLANMPSLAARFRYHRTQIAFAIGKALLTLYAKQAIYRARR